MARLLFKNKDLLPLVAITESSKVFQVAFGEAIRRYEKETKKKYKFSDELPAKYYDTETPTLYFVKDSGIYLMSAAKGLELPPSGHKVAYAQGYSPDVPNSWDKCRDAVGGDDFGESFELSAGMMQAIKEQGADILIVVTSESFTIDAVIPRAKK